MDKLDELIAMWEWLDIDENRRRIRYSVLEKRWQWVDRNGEYRYAPENKFSSAVLTAMQTEAK